MPVTLKGSVDRITFQAEDTGWTVARVRLDDERVVPVVGYLADVQPGEQVELVGEWVEHPRFGPQIKVFRHRSLVPATLGGIRKYLSSGLIKGIGPVTAERIVERFGEQTLEILDKDLSRLLEVEGIGKKRYEQIRASWEAHRDIRDVMVFLRDHGVGPAMAAKIFKEYGNRSLDVIRKNPYRLATDLYGVGFRTADRLAQSMGFDPQSVLRAEAGVLYVLQGMAEQGHVGCPMDHLLPRCESLLEIPSDVIHRAVLGLMDRGMVVMEEEAEGESPYVFLKWLHAAETGVSRRLIRMIQSGPVQQRMEWPELEAWIEQRFGLRLDDRQKEAVRTALTHPVSVITGGPGTGKTTLIRAAIEIMKRQGRTVLLAAPTGRAAKRLAVSCGQEAKTIHRLLEFNPADGGFRRGRDRPLRTDALIVDEASMLDMPLMHSLLRALPAQARLILVGDADQLPSVGPGSVLRDIIDSGVVPVIRLDRIYRQAQESLIVVNAHRINAGKWPLLPADMEAPPEPDWFFVERSTEESVLDFILELCTDRLQKRFGLDPMNDVQVLTPMNRGSLGVSNLNVRLQEVLNPGERELVRAEGGFRAGDKVMQLRNNYEKEIYNGDMGRIVSIDREEQSVWIDFEGRVLLYRFSEMDEIALAYAVSVHKSQGSEYPAVVLPVILSHYVLLQRNLIYTAVTRGRRLVILVGQKKALRLAIQNDRTRRRFSRLKERLVQSSRQASLFS